LRVLPGLVIIINTVVHVPHVHVNVHYSSCVRVLYPVRVVIFYFLLFFFLLFSIYDIIINSMMAI